MCLSSDNKVKDKYLSDMIHNNPDVPFLMKVLRNSYGNKDFQSLIIDRVEQLYNKQQETMDQMLKVNQEF